MNLDAEAEARLVERLQRRDPAAFNQFVRIYQQRVFALLYQMQGNRAEAEDLAQEVFFTVYRAIGSFRAEAKLGTWLYQIAINHCKNRMAYYSRREDRAHDPIEGALEARLTDGGPTGSRPDRPDERAEGSEMERAMRTALASLDADHRMIVVLRDVEGIAYDEIAAITGLPEGTVKSRLHRGRIALRAALERGLGWKIPV